MSVAAGAFRQWAAHAGLPGNTAAIAQVIGLARPTLQKQFIRGRVQEGVVIRAARALRLDPVGVLSQFPEYADLGAGVRPPLAVEVLSQVTVDDALLELLRRRRPDNGQTLATMQTWPEPPIPDGLRQWIDAVDPGDLRRTLAGRMAIAPSNLSAQITTNKVAPRALVEAARIANTSLVSGLAVAGVVTLDEAGWTRNARAAAMTQLRDSALHDLVTSRIAAAQRAARRLEADEEAAQRIRDTLG
ncbi:hypothetical protein ACLQ2Q_15455 [Microbacterium sp. DT81.1]|uniref:hypothetical protein n=1 Tax=Microbacterium sp. DT81.1 TaxID=3393413 RepID=UPI003CED9554